MLHCNEVLAAPAQKLNSYATPFKAFGGHEAGCLPPPVEERWRNAKSTKLDPDTLGEELWVALGGWH